ncbi:MAG TPA: TfoX/Sxy family protein [Stellaceae bacterium]|nr:TfoX/Sxy family protein [Stellaceae bacterium]
MTMRARVRGPASPARVDGVDATPSNFIAYVTEQLQRWAPISAQRLFGGHGVYRGAVVFAIISRDTLYFRTDDINRPDFEAAGAAPFRVGGPSRRIVLSYHEVPADVLDDDELLSGWAERAFAAALRRDARKAGPGRKRPAGKSRDRGPPMRRKD